jgi:hypothetical protein
MTSQFEKTRKVGEAISHMCCTCKCACMFVCVYVRVCACKFMCVCVYVYMSMRVCGCVRSYARLMLCQSLLPRCEDQPIEKACRVKKRVRLRIGFERLSS